MAILKSDLESLYFDNRIILIIVYIQIVIGAQWRKLSNKIMYKVLFQPWPWVSADGTSAAKPSMDGFTASPRIKF